MGICKTVGSPPGRSGSYACEYTAGGRGFYVLSAPVSVGMSVCLRTVDDKSLQGCPSYFYSPRSKIKEVVLWGSCLERWPPERLGNQARAPPSAYQSGVKLKVLPLMLPTLPEKQVRSSSNQISPSRARAWIRRLCGASRSVCLCVCPCVSFLWLWASVYVHVYEWPWERSLCPCVSVCPTRRALPGTYPGSGPMLALHTHRLV